MLIDFVLAPSAKTSGALTTQSLLIPFAIGELKIPNSNINHPRQILESINLHPKDTLLPPLQAFQFQFSINVLRDAWPFLN
jgi:hypothetical protein